ncbi:hypothetical protein [Streptomyces sp. NTH33]|uniref:hypothetical protein n=1 Tax=Streptomyces sp. NTH33 TaxID=1735453 RepID=UPI0015E8AD25|nr:hypothetical protein [Streptomyces sp. NTH33]
MKKFDFSVRPIPKDDNQAGDLILKSFYAKNRISDGLDDGLGEGIGEGVAVLGM